MTPRDHRLTAILLTVLLLLAAVPATAAKGGKKATAAKGGKNTGAAAEEKDAEKTWDVGDPPGESYEVTIDVTEGTWMNLDVSPDGDEIVFDLLGDLYALPIAGGDAKALTSGLAWDMQPRYSPDGEWISFTSDRAGGDNVWIMRRDGSDKKQVTKEGFRLLNNAVWSPDGDYLAARKHFTSRRSLGAGEIWLYHRTGGQGLQVNERPNDQKDLGEPAFSPDGRYVYYSRDSTPGGIFQYNKDSNGQIYTIHRIDRLSGADEVLIDGAGGAVRPTPSPNGQWLAFVRRIRDRSTLCLYDLASGRIRPLWDGLERDMQETWAIHGVYPNMAWTPSSEAIVFWAGGKIRRFDLGAGQVTEIPFHVRTTHEMMEAVRFPVEVAPESFETRMLRWVQVSPRGDKVVFESLGRIWVRDLPDGEARPLTGQDGHGQDGHFELYPSFSPDGQQVVYVTWDDEDLGSVRVASVEGGEGRVLTREPGHYVEPVFSPDATTVVYRKTGGGFVTSGLYGRDQGLYRVTSKGGEPVLISHRGVRPHFGLQSDRVYFTTFEDGDKRSLRSIGLMVREAQGFDVLGREEIVHATSEAATEMRVSPNERWLAFSERWNAYVMPFVPTGKPLAIGPKANGVPVAQVSRDAGNTLHWSGDSQTLHWSLGPELFTRDLKDAFAFLDGAPEELPEPAAEGVSLAMTVPYKKPTGKVAVVGGKVVTMRGDEVIDDGVVVIEGDRITAVGPRSEVEVPADAQVVDAAGKTVLPGIVDVHWHGSQGSAEIVPRQNWFNYASLAFGVTTIHDPSNDTSTFFAASELAKAGRITAPRLYSTGTILYGAAGDFKAEVDSLDDALSHLRRMKAVGAFSVKSYNQPRREQRQQVLEAARQLGMMVVPEGGSTFMHNMTMVVDGHTGIEHNIPVPAIYGDVAQLWGESRVGYTPTLVVSYGSISGERYWYQHTNVWENERLMTFVPRFAVDPQARRRMMAPEEEYNHVDAAKVAKKLSDLGVLVNVGAHGQREGLGAHWEMWMFVQGGMTPHEALRAATLNGARYLGLDHDLGSLEPGKLADLIVLDEDPLTDIRHSESVSVTVLGGQVYDAATMNRLGDGAMTRKPFFFEREGEGFGSAAAMAEAWSRCSH